MTPTPPARPGTRRTRRLALLGAAATLGLLAPWAGGAGGPTASAVAPVATSPAPGTTTTGPASPAPSAAAPSATTVVTSEPSTAAPAAPAASSAPVGLPVAGTAPGAAGPFAGREFHGPNAGALQAARDLAGSDPADAAALAELGATPTATWLGPWSGDVTATVRQVVAEAAGDLPVFVAYDLPGRDCGGFSAGGAASVAAYGEWVQRIASGIGSAEAVVVLEPDALALLCGDADAVHALLDTAVDVLEANPGTHTYIDAGHAAWVDPATMAARLQAAGVADADGFAVNVANHRTTAESIAYGQAVADLLGGTGFVVDTSRNGAGPGDTWCNPAGRAVGQEPTGDTGVPGVDAFLWVKTPGESDGECNGGPSAGTFWPEYALGLLGR